MAALGAGSRNHLDLNVDMIAKQNRVSASLLTIERADQSGLVQTTNRWPRGAHHAIIGAVRRSTTDGLRTNLTGCSNRGHPLVTF